MMRVAMVVSTVGYHWEEVFGGYWAFKEAGCEVDVYTVDGRPPKADPASLQPGPGAVLGLGLPPSIAPDTDRGKALTLALERAQSLERADAERVDALYLPGGHGCLFDVNRNERLHGFISRLHGRGALLSAVCHATSTFAFVRDGEGRSIVQGHALTGFPHPMDKGLIALGLVRAEFLPLPLVNDEELQRAGAVLGPVDVALAMANPLHVRVSLPFVTGVGPKAAARVARAVVKAHGARRGSARPAAAAAHA